MIKPNIKNMRFVLAKQLLKLKMLFVIVFCIVNYKLQSQTTFLTENFSTSSCAIPTGWSSTGGVSWDYATTDPGRGPGVDNTSGSGCFAQLDDSDGNGARHLLTPSLNLAGYVPTLTFYMFNNDGSVSPILTSLSEFSLMHIDVSTDGGANFTTDVEILGDNIPSENYGAWTLVTVDLTAYASATTVIRFRGVEGSSFNSDLSLDDILLTGVIACDAPTATFTVVPDCNNGQFSIDVNVSALGDATGVDVTDGTTTYQTNAGTGTYTAGPFTAGVNKTIQVNGASYSGCDIASGTLTESCNCSTTPSATVNSSNLNCSSFTYDIEVTVSNFGSGTGAEIYIDNALVQASATLSNLYTFSGYATGSHSIDVRATGPGFVSCETSFATLEICNGSDSWSASAPDILGICSPGDFTTATVGAASGFSPSCDDGGAGGSTGNNYIRDCSASNFDNNTNWVDLWYQVDLPDGTDEMTLTITGLGAQEIVGYVLHTGNPGANASNNVATTTGNFVCSFFDQTVTSHTITGLAAESMAPIYIRVLPINFDDNTGCAGMTAFDFTICASAPQPNDVDDDAIEIDGASSTGNLCSANVEAEPSETGDACAIAQESKDLWYKVTTGASDPSTYLEITIDFADATDEVVASLLTGAFSNAWEECATITSSGTNSSVSHTFTYLLSGGGADYYLRLTAGSGNAVCDFTISAQRTAENNACAHFKNSLPGYDLDNGTETLDMSFASSSGAGSIAGKDLWYAIDHNSNQSINISTSAATPSWDGVAAIYLYEYPSVSGLDCSNLSLYCSKTGLDDTDLENGIDFNLGTSDYLLRIVETTTDPSGDQLNVALTGVTSTTTILANSTCANALDVSSGSQIGNFTKAQMECVPALIMCGASSYSSVVSNAYYGAALWYKFTMPGSVCGGGAPTVSTEVRSLEISVSGLNTSSGIGTKNAYLELYSDCNTQIDCGKTINNSSNVSYSNLTPGATYYLRIVNNTSSSTSTSDFTVDAIISGDPAPCNDYVSDAYGLSVLTDLNTSALTVYSGDGATVSEFNDDVWFKFTAPSANGGIYPAATQNLSFVTVYIESVSGDGFEVELWDDVVGVDGGSDRRTVLDPQDRSVTYAADYEFFQFGHLVPGEEYYLQIDFASAARTSIGKKAGSNEQFKIAVLNPGEDNSSICGTGTAVKPTKITGCEGDCQAIYKFEVDATGNYQIEATGDGVDVDLNVWQADTESGGEQGEGYAYDYDHPCQIDRNSIGTVSSVSIPSNTHGCAAGFTGQRNVYNLTRSEASNRIYYFIEVIDQSAGGDKHGCGGVELCQLEVYALGSSTVLYNGGCPFFTPAPLPVEIISFEGYNLSGNNVLNWTTLTEISNSHYQVESSVDGHTFNSIGRVEGNGFSSEVNTYGLTDYNVSAEQTYYRLVQVDFDGKRTLSEIIVIENSIENKVVIYPNPIESNKQINIVSSFVVDSYIVVDVQGRVIKNESLSSSRFSLSTEGFGRGIYYLKLKGKKGVENFKIVVE